MNLRRALATFLSAAVVVGALAALPTSAGAIRIPGGLPWKLNVRASGAVEVSWKITSGLQGACQDWSTESGADIMVLQRPERPARGSYFNGTLAASGRTKGRVNRTLSARGGSSSDAGCPGVCAASASKIAAPPPTARAADCVSPDTKQIDASGCSPSTRTLSSAIYTVQARRASGVVPTSVLVSLKGGLKKPFAKCGNPPRNVLFDVPDQQVRVRLFPQLRKNGMVSGATKQTARCKDYPKDDGFTKTECRITWDLKVTIFRTG